MISEITSVQEVPEEFKCSLDAESDKESKSSESDDEEEESEEKELPSKFKTPIIKRQSIMMKRGSQQRT